MGIPDRSLACPESLLLAYVRKEADGVPKFAHHNRPNDERVQTFGLHMMHNIDIDSKEDQSSSEIIGGMCYVDGAHHFHYLPWMR